RKVFQAERDLPEPALRVPATANVFMTGIGGTGVVTVNQILGTAALLDGKHVRGLDQTGLSQKGGPVVSHLKISERAVEVSNKVAAGEADCYLGFDILVATSPQNLDHASGERTIAVVSTSQVPTGAMVTKTDVQFPEASGLHASIDRFTRKDENVYLDALGLDLHPEARALVDSAGADGELRRLLAIRVPELIEYQDAAYARSYVEFVTRVRDAERAATPGTTALGEAVARHLFKLMAYKDE